jgi:IS605 OrfB family transposase
VLWWIVHKQVNVVAFAVHLNQFCLEVGTDLGEDGTKTVDGISIEDPISISCDEDQMHKAIHDVGWSTFLNMLAYKAENAGRQLVKIDPKYTSQECPDCHAIEKKALSKRVHRCDCGLTIGRDHAAAFVILGRGLRLQAQTAGQLAPVA